MSQADETTTSRRTLLTRAVAGAALAGGAGLNVAAIAVTTKPDPIFAAIERERAAHAEYRRARAIEHEANLRFPGEAHRAARTDEFLAWFAEVKQTEDVGVDEWWEARDEFLETQPTTPAGLKTYLDHIEACCHPGDIDEWAAVAFPTLVAAVRALLEGGAA
jgi:4-hydroxyphenylpyruvate dioxygenase-like putative hemolysin